MKCPKCQFENRERIKFCEGCGAKMELECPKCGAEIPLGRKFCGECGHDLKTWQSFGKAIEIFRECGADGWVEKAEKELTTIS
jgi:predicted amidophosphoribosyltransferase